MFSHNCASNRFWPLFCERGLGTSLSFLSMWAANKFPASLLLHPPFLSSFFAGHPIGASSPSPSLRRVNPTSHLFPKVATSMGAFRVFCFSSSVYFINYPPFPQMTRAYAMLDRSFNPLELWYRDTLCFASPHVALRCLASLSSVGFPGRATLVQGTYFVHTCVENALLNKAF